jgi:hypothetical protein
MNKTLQKILRKMVEAHYGLTVLVTKPVYGRHHSGWHSTNAVGIHCSKPADLVGQAERVGIRTYTVVQLLGLEEERIRSMEALEHEQRLRCRVSLHTRYET